jgi:hypothetical protein
VLLHIHHATKEVKEKLKGQKRKEKREKRKGKMIIDIV